MIGAAVIAAGVLAGLFAASVLRDRDDAGDRSFQVNYCSNLTTDVRHLLANETNAKVGAAFFSHMEEIAPPGAKRDVRLVTDALHAAADGRLGSGERADAIDAFERLRSDPPPRCGDLAPG